MNNINQNWTYYQKNEIAILQRSKEYYENKGKIKGYQRNRFQKMTNEERTKLNEHRRVWYNKVDEDKKNKIRKAARDRYYAISVCWFDIVLCLKFCKFKFCKNKISDIKTWEFKFCKNKILNIKTWKFEIPEPKCPRDMQDILL